MNVLRHDHVAIHVQPVSPADTLQGGCKEVLGLGGGEQRPPVIAAESNEVALPGLLIALQSPRHAGMLMPTTAPLKPKSGLSGPPAQCGGKFRIVGDDQYGRLGHGEPRGPEDCPPSNLHNARQTGRFLSCRKHREWRPAGHLTLKRVLSPCCVLTSNRAIPRCRLRWRGFGLRVRQVVARCCSA
jgi:hypothetical protein